MSDVRLSADIGGTFTDLVVENLDGEVSVHKVDTTPRNPAEGILTAIENTISDPRDISFFVHGTTVALNALLERKGERVLLIMTEGVGDTAIIARGNRDDINSAQYRKPEPLVRRKDIHEIRERLSFDGSVVTPPDLRDLKPIIDKIRREKINVVAICFLHSYVNNEHEVLVFEKLRKAFPNLSIAMSHRVSSEWGEYERCSSTIVNGYIAPVMERYLTKLQVDLSNKDVQSLVYIMQSNGGVTTVTSAQESPIMTLMSGPVGGAIGGTVLAQQIERKNLICVDMGGTSFDVSLVIDGSLDVVTETQFIGLPLLMSSVNIHTIGAGGGSMVWLEGGRMRVGPQSAGSQPGPICYNRGGTVPTVTDANLYLHRLGADSLLQGRMHLDTKIVSHHIDAMAKTIGLTGDRFAEGILSISNAKMADAVRTITVQQGIDPRDFTLVAFGGAGPLHAAWIAEELDITEIVVPRFPGVFSAWGMLQTDMRHDFAQNYYRAAASVTTSELSTAYTELANKAKDVLASDGISEQDMMFEYFADLRYVGQAFSVTVPAVKTEQLESDFHTAHFQRYGHSTPDAPVEFVNLRLAAFGILKRTDLSPITFASKHIAPISHRNVVFDNENYDVSVYRRDSLTNSFETIGPVIIEEESSTTIIGPGWYSTIDTFGNVMITKE